MKVRVYEREPRTGFTTLGVPGGGELVEIPDDTASFLKLLDPGYPFENAGRFQVLAPGSSPSDEYGQPLENDDKEHWVLFFQNAYD